MAHPLDAGKWFFFGWGSNWCGFVIVAAFGILLNRPICLDFFGQLLCCRRSCLVFLERSRVLYHIDLLLLNCFC